MSYLQPYVRQVKSRNESYILPVEKIQSFLTETPMSKSDIFKRDNKAKFIDFAKKGSLPGTDGKKLPKVPSDDPLLVLI